VKADIAAGITVAADYVLLRMALENLIENAARYSTPGGAIHVRAGPAAAGRVRLEVRDEGPGIPAADLPHIFEKFYRGSQEGKTKGTGLGLAIVKGMVELCGGTVSVASKASGTTFTLALPAANALP
jgi:two-component system sensor histidine kinase KdpD